MKSVGRQFPRLLLFDELPPVPPLPLNVDHMQLGHKNGTWQSQQKNVGFCMGSYGFLVLMMLTHFRLKMGENCLVVHVLGAAPASKSGR